MGSSVVELQKQLRLKDERIAELERQLAEREAALEAARSDLDKYQSVLHGAAAPMGAAGPRKQRALGVSAPQTTKAMLELGKDVFKAHPKSQR